MCARIGEQRDQVFHLDERSRPAMRDDDGYRAGANATPVYEMDVLIVDRGHELRQPV